MQRNLVFLLTVAVVISMVSCSRTDKNGIAIPKDAAVVVHINASSITSKVNWSELQQTDWFKEFYSHATDSLTKNLMSDPANSGIDIKSDMAFFLKKQGQGGYAAFEGSVRNASAFEEFNKKINSGGTVSKQGDISILKLGLRTILAWNDKRFVYIMDSPMGNITMPGNSGNYSAPYQFPADSLQKFGVQLFDLERKNSLMHDQRFAALIKEPGDIHFWTNAGQYYYNILGGFLSILKLNVLFEDNVSAATLNFGNGRITMKSKTYYNKELRQLMEKYPPGEVSTDIINRIPSQNVAAVFVMKYPPGGLKDLIKLTGLDGIVNSFMGENGYSVDEFIKANKGDLLFSVSDFQMSQREITIPNPEGEPYIMKTTVPDAKFLFATSVNDKAAFDKMIAIVKARVPEEAMGMLDKVNYQLNDKWFAAGNSPEHINSFLAGGNSKLPFASRISGKAFGGYINVQQLLQSSKSAATDSTIIAAMDASVKMWQDIVITSGGKKDDAIQGEAEINLVDKNTNSLKQLNNYINTLYQIFKQRNYEYSVHTGYSGPARMHWVSF